MGIVPIRVGTTGHPTTTRALWCRSTHPYGDNGSSAAPSTNTAGQPDRRRETAAQRPWRSIWHGTGHAGQIAKAPTGSSGEVKGWIGLNLTTGLLSTAYAMPRAAAAPGRFTVAAVATPPWRRP